jgi:phosphopantothenoylcysteine decarboxylase/phosphopantothenate--cysteine ligase
MLNGKSIILGVSAGIAAYKSCEIVRELKKSGSDVHVVMTKAAHHFVTPLTLQTLSGNPVHSEMFDLISENEIGHISLADRADIILIAPATADIIAKVAAGICDELLPTIISATKAPVVFAPSMNTNMWENKITQRNISTLKELNYKFIEPEAGELACGYSGKGRLPETSVIVDFINSI